MLRRESFSIVLVGDFNPAIFQPLWFSSEKLIRPSEAEAAKVEIIHGEFSSIQFEGFSLLVTRNRLQFSTTELPYLLIVRDLALGTFRILSHTPVSQAGLNSTIHFQFENQDKCDAFFQKMAPTKIWEPEMKMPHLAKTVVSGERPDDFKGSINVIVEPSNSKPNVALFNINDHYELPEKDKLISARFVLDIITKKFDESLKTSEEIVKGLVERVCRE